MTNGDIGYRSRAMLVFMIALLFICFAGRGCVSCYEKMTDEKPIEKVE